MLLQTAFEIVSAAGNNTDTGSSDAQAIGAIGILAGFTLLTVCCILNAPKITTSVKNLCSCWKNNDPLLPKTADTNATSAADQISRTSNKVIDLNNYPLTTPPRM